jgi:probable F420-dependent oxidoreductase
MTGPASERPGAASATFGFSAFPYGRFRSPAEIGEVVVAAEQLGFDVVHLPEHLLPPFRPQDGDSQKVFHDLPALIGYLAGRTSRIRFLTSVVVVPYHEPIGYAKAIATAQLLAGGRLLFGVGSGWWRSEFKRLGIPFEERGAITDEYLDAMIALWTSEAPSFHGKYVSFEDVSFYPKPPHIPIIVGGTGPRPFRRAARIGDGWLPMVGGLEEIVDGVAAIKQQMESLGRDSAAFWSSHGVALGQDHEVAQMRHHATHGAEPSRAHNAPEEALEQARRIITAGIPHVSIGIGSWDTAGALIRGLELASRDIVRPLRAESG